MKTVLMALVFISFIGIALSAQASEYKAIEDAIKSRFDGLARAAQSLNIAAYRAFFDEAYFTALNADGTVTHNLDSFLKSYAVGTDSIEFYQSLAFSNVKVTVLNDTTAILVNEYKANLLLKNGMTVEAEGAGSQVWSFSDGEWFLVSVASSAKH